LALSEIGNEILNIDLGELKKQTQASRVLYVEDDPISATIMQKVLGDLFKEVLYFSNGMDGLNFYQSYREKIDLIITDITMPGMNGLEMVKAIKATHPDIPVVIVSAHNDTDFFLQAIDIGVEFFIVKPIDVNQVGIVLFKVMEKIRVRHELRKIREIYTDQLTGLPTRSKFIMELNEKNSGTLFQVNIHSFQNLNNFYGHEFGDKVLRNLSASFKEHTTNTEWFPYYFGSDQFGLYNPTHLSAQDLRIFVKKTVAMLQTLPIFIDGVEIYISVYSGIATIGLEKTTTEDLINHATLAQMEAKKRRLSSFYFERNLFEEDIGIKNIFWIKRINEAILNDLVILYYQPLYDIKNDVIDKYETLMRMKTPTGEIIPPDRFLPVAKKTSLYSKLTIILLTKIFDKLKESKYNFSINLSFLDISNADTTEYLLALMKENPEDSKRLIIEITESEGILNYREVVEFMMEARKHGIRFAIDDFGSGYSNFTYLMDLNVDYIKIDGSIISSILKSDKVHYITKMITEFCKYCGLKTIAEYVSNRQIYERLLDLGIDYAQGYYIGKPSEHLITIPEFKIPPKIESES
jgi:diguanylate cyclase (GGDEF)-like protein